MRQEHYELRYLNKTKDYTSNFSLLGVDNKVLLADEIFRQKKIVLLGNPGIGKTTELKHLFDDLWERKDESGLIPFFIDLKYFRRANKFEDLILYKDWKSLPNVVFILDSLDEIEHLHDFISEFEIFTTKHADLGLRYVISCRTNIYEKYLVKISGFQTYYLQNLNFDQAKSILYNKYEIEIDKLSIDEKNKEFIQSPFFLRLFAEFYRKEGRLPTSDSEIWNLYINETINTHKTKYIKKGLIQKPILINRLEKVAFINELMQRNYISDAHLFEIFNYEYETFTSNPPLINYNSAQDNWSFEHRQVQEFFVAKVLLNKNLDQILEIIKIDNINAIHPSLFNSITFLINLFDEIDPVRIGLIDWLKENQIEILFKADSDRIDKKIRVNIFQEYFKKECIEKTLWINTRRTFEPDEIGRFGNCKENFDFLLVIVNNFKKYHFRALFSAIELMNFFSPDSYSTSILKKELFDKLKLEDFPIGAKSQILRLIKKHHLVGLDKEYLNRIYDLFKTETNKQLNNNLLLLLSDEENIDQYYEFIKHEYLLAHNIERRLELDEVLRGNRLILNKLILRIQDPKNFLEIISIYFNNELRPTYANDFELGLVDKCLSLIKEDPNFIIDLFSVIKDDYRFFRHDEVLEKIVKASNKQSEVISYLLKSSDVDDNRYFISKIVKEENIEKLVEELIEGDASQQQIEYFRNNIGNTNSRKLAVYFNDLMEEKGIGFKEEVFSEEKFIRYQEDYNLHIQNNFDILFDKKRLTDEIKNVLENYNNEISRERLNELRRNWYEQNGHGNEIDTALSILENLMFSLNLDVLPFSEVDKIFERDDFFLVDTIRKKIEKHQNKNKELIISKEQKKFLENWSLSMAEKIDFKSIAKATGPTSFSYSYDYKKMETVFYFQKRFGFVLPNDFLLNSIEFYEFDKTGELDESFYYLKSLISDDKMFDKQIVYNLNEKQLLGLSKSKHIEYALKHNLSECFKSIREYLIQGESFFNERTKLEDYVNLTNDKEILLELCFDEESYIYWRSIDLMLKLNINKDFCISCAIQYLDLKKEKFKTDAFKILMELNHIKTYEYLIDALRDEKPFSLYSIKFSHFNNIPSSTKLGELFELIYSTEIDGFESSYYRDFFRALITNLSSNGEDFPKIQEVLHGIKKDLKDKKSDLFHINLLIDDSENAYINSKSKPYTFKQAKKIALEFIK